MSMLNGNKEFNPDYNIYPVRQTSVRNNKFINNTHISKEALNRLLCNTIKQSLDSIDKAMSINTNLY